MEKEPPRVELQGFICVLPRSQGKRFPGYLVAAALPEPMRDEAQPLCAASEGITGRPQLKEKGGEGCMAAAC